MELIIGIVNGSIIILFCLIGIIINREKILRKFFSCDILGHYWKRTGWICKAGVTRRDLKCIYYAEETSIVSDFPGNF